MKATHNIKIDGVWYKAGDELPEEKAQEPAVTEPEEKAQEPAATEPEAEPEKAEESKPRSTRRKKLSE